MIVFRVCSTALLQSSAAREQTVQCHYLFHQSTVRHPDTLHFHHRRPGSSQNRQIQVGTNRGQALTGPRVGRTSAKKPETRLPRTYVVCD